MRSHVTCPNPTCGAKLPSDMGRCPICRTPVAELVVKKDGAAEMPASVSAEGRELVAAPLAQGEPEATTDRPPRSLKEYGGIPRHSYIIYSIGIGTLWMIVSFRQQGPAAAWLVHVLGLGAAFCVTVPRLHNLGMSGLWSLLLLVPIVNILLTVRCSAFPEGYADHRQLDLAARVILGCILALLVIPLGLVMVLGVLSRFR
jgi:uncharacterized membrane protein YhaH (DUF805 family)